MKNLWKFLNTALGSFFKVLLAVILGEQITPNDAGNYEKLLWALLPTTLTVFINWLNKYDPRYGRRANDILEYIRSLFGKKDEPTKIDEPKPTIIQPAPQPVITPTPLPVAIKKAAPVKKATKPTKQSAFVAALIGHAAASESKTGLSAVANLAQAALETGWNSKPPGNMFYGIKASKDTKPGKKQLLITHEVLRRKTKSPAFPVTISISPVPGKPGLYRHKVKDWFRKYDTPEESFVDRAKFFIENPIYATAWQHRHDADRFFEEIAKAGYATDPHYAAKLKSIAKTIRSLI